MSCLCHSLTILGSYALKYAMLLHVGYLLNSIQHTCLHGTAGTIMNAVIQ